MMRDREVRVRESAQARRRKSVRPAIEGLEDRMLLYAVTGDHFAFGSRITWSIMPDGTNLGGIPSNFVATMNQKLGPGWITALDDAFAQWENVANVNFAQVPDSGAPWGSGGYQQGDPTMGDIRIGGLAGSQNLLAFTILPPTANGGSDSGDIFFNTSQTWNISSNVDLETVALHEIGHALGMAHSTDVNAVMYPYYGGVQQNLGTDDIAGVRSIWKARQEDPIEMAINNLTSAYAANVTNWITPSNNQVYLPSLDVASSAESYWYKVTTPSNATSNFTVQVQSSNLSELSPRVVIYNASLQGLTQAAAPANAYGATITASIANSSPNTTYYIKVLGSNSGDTGTGGYTMTFNMGGGAIAAASPPNTTVSAQPDQGGGVDELDGGTIGGWLKSWVRSGEQTPLSTLTSTENPILAAEVTLIAFEMTSGGPLAAVLLQTKFVEQILETPIDVLGGSTATGNLDAFLAEIENGQSGKG